MEWSKKVKLIEYSQTGELSCDLENFVRENIEDFDCQSLEMLVNLILITPENINPHKEFLSWTFNQLQKNNKEIFINMDFQSQLRFNLINRFMNN